MRVGFGALVALAVLLAGTGTGVASDATQPPLRLAALAPAPALERGAGYGSSADAKRVRAVQRVLRRQGWAPGRVDGLFGPRTEAAVTRFQAAAGLAVDGVVGAHTARALAQAGRGQLRRGAGYQSADGSQRVLVLQRRLARQGLEPGPLDGRYGPRTEAAVARLQQAAHLKASGAVNTRTQRVLARGSQQRVGNARRVTTGLETLPRTVRSTAVSSLAESADESGPTVGLWLVVLVSAAAMALGALCGAPFTRARARGGSEAAAGRSEPVRDPAGRSERASDEHTQLLAAERESRSPDRQQTAVAAAAASNGHREPVRAVGYVSVPKANGQDSGALEQQAASIDRLCQSRGWELLHVVRDVENGHPKGLERPGLLYALERIAEGEASCLVVSELERLSQSAADLGRIVEWIEQRDARLVAIDLRLDTGSAQGRLTARTLVAVGEWEGRRIADQTKKGLAAAKARRATTGRPAVEDLPALKARIVHMRSEGMTLQAIADRLNAEQVPTLRGGAEWRPSSVQAAAGYRRPKAKRSNLADAKGGPGMT